MNIDLSKIGRLVSIAAALYSLTSGQEKELEGYVKMNMYSWQAEMRREEEIDKLIKNEASKISKR